MRIACYAATNTQTDLIALFIYLLLLLFFLLSILVNVNNCIILLKNQNHFIVNCRIILWYVYSVSRLAFLGL